MKLFGEYLVEKGVIKDSQLLECLILQIEEQPSIQRIVYDHKLLGSPEILSVLKTQAMDKSSFVEAAKKISLWTDALSERVHLEISQKRSPLGELLVRKRYLDIVTLTKSLDDFFGQKTSSAPVSGTTQNSASASEISEEIDAAFLASIASLRDNYKAAPSQHPSELAKFCDELHRLLGAAKLFDSKELSELFDKTEQGFRCIKNVQIGSIKVDLFEKISKALEDFRVILVAIKENGAKHGSLNSGPIAEKLKYYLDSLMLIDFDVGHLPKEKT